MALNNTAFTPLLSGTRDSTSDKGAIYFLDGNSSNGRIHINVNAIWKIGDNTHIIYDGNPNHSFMKGTMESVGLVFIAKPTGGRADFFSGSGGNKGIDTTLVFLGSGSVFCHLESVRNQFTGFVRFIFDMTGGRAYVQFASREYANVTLDIKDSNKGELNFYPARSHSGHTSLTGFRTKNFNGTFIFLRGTQSTSHARIYDPKFEGVDNNLLSIKRQGGGADNDQKEYFTIDVTNIASDTMAIRVMEGTNVQHNKYLTSENTIIYANDGKTPLDFYSGKKVIPCLVRTIGSTTSSTRNSISYLIRRADIDEIRLDNFALNNPVVIEQVNFDAHFDTSINPTAITGISVTDTTITVSEVVTLQQFYNYLKYWLSRTANTGISHFLAVTSSELSIAGYNVTLNEGAKMFASTNLTSLVSTGDFSANAVNSVTCHINFANIASTKFENLESGGYLKLTGSKTGKFLERTNNTETLIWLLANKTEDLTILQETSTTLYNNTFLPSNWVNQQAVLTLNLDELLATLSSSDVQNVINAGGLSYTAGKINLTRKNISRTDTLILLNEIAKQDINITLDDIYSRNGDVLTLLKEIEPTSTGTFTGWKSIVLPTTQELATMPDIGVPVKIGTTVFCNFTTSGDYSIYAEKLSDNSVVIPFEKLQGGDTKRIALTENEDVTICIAKDYHIPIVEQINILQGVNKTYNLELNRLITADDDYIIGIGGDIELSNPTDNTIKVSLSDKIFEKDKYKAALSRMMSERQFMQAMVRNNDNDLLVIADTGVAKDKLTFVPQNPKKATIKYYITSSVSGFDLYPKESTKGIVAVDINPLNVNIPLVVSERFANLVPELLPFNKSGMLHQNTLFLSGFESTANGQYILLSDTSKLAFSPQFNPTGVNSEIDSNKPVYVNKNGWYLWARQGSGYHLSRLNNLTQWYWEVVSNPSEFVNSPVFVAVWSLATGEAPQSISAYQNGVINLNDIEELRQWSKKASDEAEKANVKLI